VQARYSVAIAKNAGADRFAMPAYASATTKLAVAESALLDKNSRKTAPGLAREAVTAGEDARRAGMLASAEAATEAKRLAAEQAANEATAVAAQAANQATAVAAQAANQATAVAAQAATASTIAATQVATDVERQRSSEEAAVTARRDLLGRLNAALPTRESNRGLVSEIGGVEFATGAAGINTSARENLAKFSGVVASYPALRFNVEGHTDSTGSVATNNALSMPRRHRTGLLDRAGVALRASTSPGLALPIRSAITRRPTRAHAIAASRSCCPEDRSPPDNLDRS
jgi:outer membrane protein OmpA-like peptidoglycan-associated protein